LDLNLIFYFVVRFMLLAAKYCCLELYKSKCNQATHFDEPSLISLQLKLQTMPLKMLLYCVECFQMLLLC